jgi:aryl-alcohol dehydrogenase-like predicted oxidoreductase
VSILLRNFGRSNIQVSALGCGGHHLGDPQEEKIARQIVDQVIDGGGFAPTAATKRLR